MIFLPVLLSYSWCCVWEQALCGLKALIFLLSFSTGSSTHCFYFRQLWSHYYTAGLNYWTDLLLSWVSLVTHEWVRCYQIWMESITQKEPMILVILFWLKFNWKVYSFFYTRKISFSPLEVRDSLKDLGSCFKTKIPKHQKINGKKPLYLSSHESTLISYFPLRLYVGRGTSLWKMCKWGFVEILDLWQVPIPCFPM